MLDLLAWWWFWSPQLIKGQFHATRDVRCAVS